MLIREKTQTVRNENPYHAYVGSNSPKDDITKTIVGQDVSGMPNNDQAQHTRTSRHLLKQPIIETANY